MRVAAVILIVPGRHTMFRFCACVFIAFVTACGPIEMRIDESKGIPAVEGQVDFAIGSAFVCGEAIAAGNKTVTTRAVTGGCEFSFDDTIEILTAADYQRVGELKSASNLVQRVELSIEKLAFVDGDSGATLDLSTRVTGVNVIVNGQLVADKTTVSKLPTIVKIEGDALAPIKAKVDARQPASVSMKVIAILPDNPKPPAKLKIDYKAQPALIIGPGTIKPF